MGNDLIPYDPYHPHLGYTLVVSCVACASVLLYSRFFLRRQPRLQVLLYALAIGLPIVSEGLSFLINQFRPAPDTPLGYFLTHFHAQFLQRVPIDSFLSPTASDVVLVLLSGLAVISLVRFVVGTRQLNRALVTAVPLAQTPYQPILSRMLAIVDTQYGAPPPIYVFTLPS